MSVNNIWLGVGLEAGGEILAGVDSHEGGLFCYGDAIRTPKLTRYCTVSQRSASLGLGLGGSGGFTFLIGLNGSDPQQFASDPKWAFDYSLDLGALKLAKYVQALPQITALAKALAPLKRAGFDAFSILTAFDDNRKFIKDAGDLLVKNHTSWFDVVAKQATIICLPMPMANGGLRISLKAKRSTTEVKTWGTFEFGF